MPEPNPTELSITGSSPGPTFALNGHGMTYRFGVDPNSLDLISNHFGGPVDQDVPAWTARFGVWSPEPKLRRREFPEFGHGDFRTPAIHIRHGEGHSTSDFKYDSHSVVRGKPRLEGLPSTFGTEDEVKTVVVHMRDAENKVSANLTYSVFAKHDAVVRSVKITNEGDKTVTIDKVASMSFDLPTAADRAYDLTGLHGEWGRERQRTRSRIRPGVQR